MGNVAVKVENLGKMYRIGGPQEKYQTFRDAITKAVSAPFKRARDLLRGEAYGAAGLTEEIWALKDVSFEVKHGEVVGIIGRNGAGKSTLLKILSRITEPTTGYADVYGRVGALLEVGTGFHPELTGRENVYLNGAILGMSRNDINRKFDEIVDFAGIEKFIAGINHHYLLDNYASMVRKDVQAAFGELYRPGLRWIDKFKRGHQSPALLVLERYQDNPRMTYAIRSLLEEQHPTEARLNCPWPNLNRFRQRAKEALMKAYGCSA